MIKKYIILLILTGWFYSTAKAVDGVECQINIYQFDKKLQKDILTFADTNNFAINIPRSGFIGPLSVEIDVIEVDSAKVNFNIHVITLGPLANTYTRNFLVEHSLPAKICGIKGKNDALYTLVVTPLSKIDIDTTTCSFQH
ncbi:MAG: hypothetical protein ACE5D6_05700, partial [Candidatus Zixiibacteriota bacterium]